VNVAVRNIFVDCHLVRYVLLYCTCVCRNVKFIVLSSLSCHVFGSQAAVKGNSNEEPYAKEFGIEIKKELVSLDARVLPPPWVNVSVRSCIC